MAEGRWVRVISGSSPDGQRRCSQYVADSEESAVQEFLEDNPGFEVTRREHYFSKGR